MTYAVYKGIDYLVNSERKELWIGENFRINIK